MNTAISLSPSAPTAGTPTGPSGTGQRRTEGFARVLDQATRREPPRALDTGPRPSAASAERRVDEDPATDRDTAARPDDASGPGTAAATDTTAAERQNPPPAQPADRRAGPRDGESAPAAADAAAAATAAARSMPDITSLLAQAASLGGVDTGRDSGAPAPASGARRSPGSVREFTANLAADAASVAAGTAPVPTAGAERGGGRAGPASVAAVQQRTGDAGARAEALQQQAAASSAAAALAPAAAAALSGTATALRLADGAAQPASTAAPSSGTLDAAAAAAAGTAGSLPSGVAAAPPAPAEAQLSARWGSEGFAAQLSQQISTYVRDGIEHARLHLNPAEMGPVQVQIQLDGQAAWVHLGADQSATRQVLEQALPQLAATLREAGFTLAGGGVSDQARQGQPGAADTPRGAPERSDSAGTTVPVAPAATGTVRTRGLVDLLA